MFRQYEVENAPDLWSIGSWFTLFAYIFNFLKYYSKLIMNTKKNLKNMVYSKVGFKKNS